MRLTMPISITRQQQLPRQQRGVVLITALVFLVILTLLGITSMSTNTLEERMAANSQDINRAFQTAETGVAQAFSASGTFSGTTANFSSAGQDTAVGTYGATTTYSSSYRGSESIQFQDISNAASAGTFKYHYFDLQSTGATQSGATTTVGVGARLLGT
jgi:hypothetical protein